MSYLGTFFGTTTASQYTCELFSTSEQDFQRLDAVFTNRLSYTNNEHEQVKVWVAANIDRWRADKPDWFKIKTIQDDLLPNDVVGAEGGKNRKRSTVSIREVIGNSNRVHPQRS